MLRRRSSSVERRPLLLTVATGAQAPGQQVHSEEEEARCRRHVYLGEMMSWAGLVAVPEDGPIHQLQQADVSVLQPRGRHADPKVLSQERPC